MRPTSVIPFRLRSSTAAVAAALLCASPLQGQESAREAEITSVQITGSRIARDGFSSPTPVSVLDAEAIDAEAPASIADFVNTLPSVAGSSTSSTSSGALSNGAAGIAALNLRGLGVGRTLVLFDGQRSVVSASTGQVDTNTFPQSLVRRVEVVTGGASSAYGSDAIGGVVNFILDREFTGIKTAMEYGEIKGGLNQSERFEFTGGMSFADGAGHILFSTEQYNADGVHYYNPDWNQSGWFAMPNPDTSPGAPEFLVQSGVGIGRYTAGGLIGSGPLAGTYFGTNGTVNQFAYGEMSGQWMTGGDWKLGLDGIIGTNSLASDDKRESYFARVSYEISPSLEVYVQGSLAEYTGLSYYINPTDINRRINVDNAYLPASVRDEMIALGLTSFTMSTSNGDFDASGSNNNRETERWVFGVDGEFFAAGLNFNWDAYYQLGITETDELMTPTYNFSRLTLASDAVFHPQSGEIVCRSSIADPGNGCVPLNRLGVGVASQEGIDYVMGRPHRQQKFQQDVAAINLSTNDIQGWAGPISVAVGAEWREESVGGYVDEIYESDWKYGNYKVTTGSYDVVEAYVETIVPIMDNLEFNGAARWTDYSTSGNVTTWKTGLTYTPIDDITLRLTKSRDIRAPNLEELFAAGTARTNAVAINNQSVPFVQNLRGNTTVGPEEAETLGVGMIVQPRFLPDVQLSIDYYEIEVDGVINFLSAQQITDFCYLQNVTRYCSNLIFDDGGTLQFIDLLYENLNSLSTKGLDLELSYGFALDQLFSWGAGEVRLRALATHFMENITDNGTTAIDQAGENSGSTPDWRYRLTAGYTLDDWTFNLTARGVSSGVVGNDLIECAANCPAVQAPFRTINNNRIDGEWFFDLYAAKSFELAQGQAELFISVKNLLDTDPPLVATVGNQGSENRPGYIQSNRNLYDVFGRNFRFGVRYDF